VYTLFLDKTYSYDNHAILTSKYSEIDDQNLQRQLHIIITATGFLLQCMLTLLKNTALPLANVNSLKLFLYCSCLNNILLNKNIPTATIEAKPPFLKMNVKIYGQNHFNNIFKSDLITLTVYFQN